MSPLEERRSEARGLVAPKPLCIVLMMIGTMLAIPAKALDPQKLISQFTHTSWTAKDGVPGPVRAIAQTPDGYLWLGTEAGLYRFDGLHFVAWEPGSGEQILGSSVWSLCTSRDGGLVNTGLPNWIAAVGARLERSQGTPLPEHKYSSWTAAEPFGWQRMD